MADITILDMKGGGRQRLTALAGVTVLPAGSATHTLFNSLDNFGVNKLLDTPIKRISLTLFHNQAGTLDASRSIDGGITWRVYSRLAVAIPAANTISGAYHYIVEQFGNWKLEWVNGGVSQTIFEPELVAYETRMPTED